MESLAEGESPVLAVRVPAELNERIERWAASRGEEVADSLRALMNDATECAPEGGIVVRPPRRWMTASLHHSCFRRRGRGTGPCEAPWAHDPASRAFCRVSDGPDWSGLDDLLRATAEDHVAYDGSGFYLVPSAYLRDLSSVFRGHESRIVVHHLDRDGSPYLVQPDGV